MGWSRRANWIGGAQGHGRPPPAGDLGRWAKSQERDFAVTPVIDPRDDAEHREACGHRFKLGLVVDSVVEVIREAWPRRYR